MVAKPRHLALLGDTLCYDLPEIAHALLADTCDELQLLAQMCGPLQDNTRLVLSATALSRQYARLASQLTDVLDSCHVRPEQGGGHR